MAKTQEEMPDCVKAVEANAGDVSSLSIWFTAETKTSMGAGSGDHIHGGTDA